MFEQLPYRRVNTSSVSTGCVGHTSVHGDSGSCAWGSGVCVRAPRCVEQQQQHRRCVEQQQQHRPAARTIGLLLGGEVVASPPPSAD